MLRLDAYPHLASRDAFGVGGSSNRGRWTRAAKATTARIVAPKS